MIKCYLEQTKPALPPTQQHEPVNITIALQRPFLISTCKRQNTPSKATCTLHFNHTHTKLQ